MRLPHLFTAAVIATALPAFADDQWVVDKPTLTVRADGKRMTVTSSTGFVKNGVPTSQVTADLAPCRVMRLYAKGSGMLIATLDGTQGKTYEDLVKECEPYMIEWAARKADAALLAAVIQEVVAFVGGASPSVAHLERAGLFAKVIITAPDTQDFYLMDGTKAVLPEADPGTSRSRNPGLLPGVGTGSPSTGTKPGILDPVRGGGSDLMPKVPPKP